MKIEAKTIETDRLILRKFNIKDINDVYNNWGTDSNCNKFLPWELHKNLDETKELVINWIQKYSDMETKKINWAIELKENHEVIGAIDVLHIKPEDKRCGIGYCIGSKFWNNGYTTEALKVLINYLFTELDFNLIEADHYEKNPSSGRVMQKAGMKKDAVLRNRVYLKDLDCYDNLVVYSITKDEFKGVK